MRGRLMRNILYVLTFISLVAATAFIPAILYSIDPTSQSVRKQTIVQVMTGEQYGKLVVFLLLGSIPAFVFEKRVTYPDPVDVITIFKPLPSENVIISRSDGHGDPLIKKTNSSGSFEAVLPVSVHYRLAINESRFHIEIPVHIVEGKTTRVIVQANKLAYEVFFQDLSDRYSSGWGTSSDPVFLQIHSNDRIANISDVIFLQTLTRSTSLRPSSSGTENLAIHETRVVVLAEDQKQNTLWLQVRSLENIKDDGIIGTVVLTYRPTYSVTVGDG